jgi:hypothetical protein
MTISRITVLSPGQIPPHVTIADLTLTGSNSKRSKGPTRVKERGTLRTSSAARALRTAPSERMTCESMTQSP